MATPPLPEGTLKETLETFSACDGNVTRAARLLGIPRSTFQNRMRAVVRIEKAPAPRMPLVRAPVPSESLPTADLVARRKAQFNQKQGHHEALKCQPVRVQEKGPIAILHMGDPHLDDDGTDLGAIERHLELAKRTPGMYLGNIGDLTNNWQGRLARLYAEQSTSEAEAWQLVEWFTGYCPDKWLYFITGNHDNWTPHGPLKYIAEMNRVPFDVDGARMQLIFPNARSVIVNARHQFPGHSMYNVAHAPLKQTIFNTRDHLSVQGHIHSSGHSIWKDAETGRACHSLVVASYKQIDAYASQRGLRDNRLSPCAVTVIDPGLPDNHPDLIVNFWTPEAAADYLTWKRSKK